MKKMFKLLCICIFVTKYVNGAYYFSHEKDKINPNDDEIKRKMLSYFDQTSWGFTHSQNKADLELRFGSAFQKPLTIIQEPTIETTYRTEIMIQQSSHPYLFEIMQMIPIKAKISFEYLYQKLFKYFIALKNYTTINFFSIGDIKQILYFVFPEFGEKINEIAKYPLGVPMLRAIIEIMFPGISKQEFNLLFKDVHTTPQLIINLILYFCPNIKQHFLWNDDLPINNKLSLILQILFPGTSISSQLLSQQGDIQKFIYTFLDLLFQGKLISNAAYQQKPEGPEWSHFQNILFEYKINYQTLPKDILYYLFSEYKSPEFKTHLIKLMTKLEEENKTNKMDSDTLKIWIQYLNDLKTHQKTLNDMPSEIKIFLQQYDNPQEFIKTMSNILGFEIDVSKLNIPLDPKIMELWKKFIFDIMNHNGDTAHLPKPLLDYFNSLSQNPNYKTHLDVIFGALSINPQIVIKWNTFFDQIRDGKTTLDLMPKDLTTFLTNQKHPEEFLRIILKLKDSKFDTNFLNIDTNPKMMKLWKEFIENVAENKGNLRDIPEELLQYFYKISSNPAHVEYIKLIFAPDKINPKTLNTWNQFIGDLKMHRVDLHEMPSDLIQLMLKYKSPDEFFKVILPQTNINVNVDIKPDDKVKEQWKDWILKIKNHNISIFDTPKELRDYFQQISSSKDFQSTLNDIYSINPDLLLKWKVFMNDLKQHKNTIFTMPNDLKTYILNMKSPKDFVNLIFKGLDYPLNDYIPTPSSQVLLSWQKFLKSLTVKTNIDGEIIDDVIFYVDISNYLQNASNDTNYKHDLNYIYQMTPHIKIGLEDFKNNILNDYNVFISSLPKKLLNFFYRFEDITDMFRSILSAYPQDFQLNLNPDILPLNIFWSNLRNNVNNIPNDITFKTKLMIMNLIKNTFLQTEIQRVFKADESNKLISKTELLWKGTKTESPVHDGIEVFIQFINNFGILYGNTEELCEDRFRITEALNKLKDKFAANSKCINTIV